MISLRPRVTPVALATALAAVALPLSAAADDEPRQEMRRAGTCTGSSAIELRLETDDDAIEVELEIETRAGSRWSVILLHERRIFLRRAMRARGGSLALRRSVPNWFGSETVAARATGPRGESCRVSATL